jgi:Patatin-like phospholipase
MDRSSYTPEQFAHPTDECDVITKGGITSGVVYPLAVCELAQRYRLRNVGGTSAGAIAAVLAAAAELGRDAPGGGFTKLAELPQFLPKNLLSLFQPNRATRPAFEVLLAWLGPAGACPYGGQAPALPRIRLPPRRCPRPCAILSAGRASGDCAPIGRRVGRRPLRRRLEVGHRGGRLRATRRRRHHGELLRDLLRHG